MIGYYVHHHGRGHLHRAQALAQALARTTGETTTGLSSLPRPPEWCGPWLELPRDDTARLPGDVTAGGQLHWVPYGDTGLRARSAAISGWLETARPRLVVVDVSVEATILVRLHGVPVVAVLLPGLRTDPAHLLGYRVASAVVTFSPLAANELVPGLPDDIARRVTSLGAVSRFPVVRPAGGFRVSPSRVLVLQGQGGGPSLAAGSAETLRAHAPDWRWTVIGGPDSWVEDPSASLREADVVVTNAGESALADVAAHRRPAVVIPAARPFGEQERTATLLSRGDWPVVVVPRLPETGAGDLLTRAARLDGARWQHWCDGLAADRFARVIAGDEVLSGSRSAR